MGCAYDHSHLAVRLTARTFESLRMLLCVANSCFHSFLLFCAVSTSKSCCYRFAIWVRKRLFGTRKIERCDLLARLPALAKAV